MLSILPEPQTQPCPRSPAGQPGGTVFKAPFSGEHSHWRKEDDSCSYCGSLSNEVFMERLRAGDVEVGPTDKSYKVYVRNKGGQSFRQTYRNCPRDAPRHGPDDCEHWVTRDVEEHKFYFQHLTENQMREFVTMMNSGLIAMGYPGHFYTLPFFVGRKSA